MQVLIVSDLHIYDSNDLMYGSLLRLLSERACAGDIVVLAGDLFDLFVGNKKVFQDRYREFLSTLADATSRGVTVHYIEGNHDFLMSQTLSPIIGVSLHSHHVVLDVEGKRFYVGHGDTVDQSDYLYLILRLFLRSPLMKGLTYLTPGGWLESIGRYFSHLSGGKKPRLPARLPIGHLERLRKIFRSYAAETLSQGYDFAVLGHCHDLDEMSFNIGGRVGQYVNVGYPRIHGSFLTWTSGEQKIQREGLPTVAVINESEQRTNDLGPAVG